jgi:L-amino acid N-acyltransferase YncA
LIQVGAGITTGFLSSAAPGHYNYNFDVIASAIAAAAKSSCTYQGVLSAPASHPGMEDARIRAGRPPTPRRSPHLQLVHREHGDHVRGRSRVETRWPAADRGRARRRTSGCVECEGELLGYAYRGALSRARRLRPGRPSPTIYLRHGLEGKGFGAPLYAELIRRTFARGYRHMVGAIALPNEASVRLHERLGFVKAGHLVRIGRKFEPLDRRRELAARARERLSVIPREELPELEQLGRCASERELEMARVQEVAVQRVFLVDADAAVQVGRRVHDALAPSAHQNFATETCFAASRPAEIRHAACQLVSRIASVSMNASAARWPTAWNIAIG